MSLLTCPLCGEEQDADGPGVVSWHGRAGNWQSAWAPFIEDLRGSPTRLVHPACFVRESGLDALLQLIHEHDLRTRSELARRWRTEHLDERSPSPEGATS